MKYLLLISVAVSTATFSLPAFAQDNLRTDPSTVTAGSLTTPSPNASNVSGNDGGKSSSNITQDGALNIELKDLNGAPIKGAVITISRVNGERYRELRTKEDSVHLGDLAAPGEYSVCVTASGYQPETLRVATNAATPVRLAFELRPLPGQDSAFDSLMATLPPKARREVGKAMDGLRGGDLPKAERALGNLQRIAPEQPEVNYLLGVYAAKSNHPDRAKFYWTRTLEIDPQHLRTLFSLCDTYLHEKNLDGALDLAKRAVQSDPSSWRAHALLADVEARKNNDPEALQQAERAFELSHGRARVVEPLLANLLASSGNKERAIEVLKSYLVNQPADTAVKAQLARIEEGKAIAEEPPHADDFAVSRAVTALVPASNWVPHDVDESTPAVESSAGCDLAKVVSGAGKRIEELLINVDRFTATESIFHESIDKWGTRDYAASRKYPYVASIKEYQPGYFNVTEYRGSTGHPAQFPEGVATNGLPALALIFHPHSAGNFELACEGRTHWNGVAVWQVHFRQRPDKPNTIKAYQQTGRDPSHAIPLKGRAWIAADTFQLVRLEADMVAPMPEIRLMADHNIIEYGPVHFRETGTDLWLPRSAEVFFHWNNVRMHRIHSFSNYLLFSVDDQQKIAAPKVTASATDVPNLTRTPPSDSGTNEPHK